MFLINGCISHKPFLVLVTLFPKLMDLYLSPKLFCLKISENFSLFPLNISDIAIAIPSASNQPHGLITQIQNNIFLLWYNCIFGNYGFKASPIDLLTYFLY